VLPEPQEHPEHRAEGAPKKTPKIEYRRKRWTPE